MQYIVDPLVVRAITDKEPTVTEHDIHPDNNEPFDLTLEEQARQAYIDAMKAFKAPALVGADIQFIKAPILKRDVQFYDLTGLAIVLRRAQAIVGARNTKAGWRNDDGSPRPTGDMIALIHTEISEAFEGWRRGNINDDHLKSRKMIEVELADAVYRIFDLADEHNLDLGGAFAEKMSYNITRADHKRENRLAEGGKKI